VLYKRERYRQQKVFVVQKVFFLCFASTYSILIDRLRVSPYPSHTRHSCILQHRIPQHGKKNPSIVSELDTSSEVLGMTKGAQEWGKKRPGIVVTFCGLKLVCVVQFASLRY
jgi:hypothetical protein